jgi:type 1 fimbria pilin
MNIKMSAISASVLLMSVGSVMAEDYEIQYSGSVVSESCVVTGQGNGLLFELQPVMASTLQGSVRMHNPVKRDKFASVICGGDMETVTLQWSPSITTVTSAYNNTPALVPEGNDSSATGAYIHTYFQAVQPSGTSTTRNLGQLTPLPLGLKKNADGQMQADITVWASYVTKYADEDSKDETTFEKVTAGNVLASAPIILSYK